MNNPVVKLLDLLYRDFITVNPDTDVSFNMKSFIDISKKFKRYNDVPESIEDICSKYNLIVLLNYDRELEITDDRSYPTKLVIQHVEEFLSKI